VNERADQLLLLVDREAALADLLVEALLHLLYTCQFADG
jgi:CheY-like chemotaxis protein